MSELGRAPFLVDVFGRYTRDQLTQRWTDAPRPTTPAIEAMIARTWETEQALAQENDRVLYNGRVGRLVRAQAAPACLHLELGPTCYRDFVGTNLHNAATVLQSKPEGLANPLGISATVITRDGFLAYGRRSDRVAYHAGFLHAFGGMLEPADLRGPAEGGPETEYDIFGSAVRELREELGIGDEEITEAVIVGLVRDCTLHQPELLFDVTLTLTREALAARFDPALSDGEHTDIEFVCDEPKAMIPFLTRTAPVSPITQASVLLHGHHNWGTTWYEQTCHLLYGELPRPVGKPRRNARPNKLDRATQP